MNQRVLTAGIATAVLLLLLWSSLFEVQQAQVALVLRLGAVHSATDDPGLHFKLPLIDNVLTYDARLLDLEPDAEEIILGDQKRIDVDTYTLFRISDPLLFYQAAQSEANARAQLEKVVGNAVRQVLGNYPLSDVLSPKRETIMHAILDQVSQQAKQLGITIADVRIRQADLPTSTSQSIYARMQSERQREAAEARGEGQMKALQIRADADRQRTVILADAQRQAQITRGEGDAEATRIYAQAYGQDAKFYDFYRSLQAYQNALASGNTTYVLTLQSEFFKFLNAPLATPTGVAPPEVAPPGAVPAAPPAPAAAPNP